MEKFEIEVHEFLSKIVDVEAESSYDAILKVREQYFKTEIVLDYNDFVEVDFLDINTVSQSTEKDNLINEVIDYLYTIEKKHYYENKPADHVYLKLKRLKELINS